MMILVVTYKLSEDANFHSLNIMKMLLLQIRFFVNDLFLYCDLYANEPYLSSRKINPFQKMSGDNNFVRHHSLKL